MAVDTYSVENGEEKLLERATKEGSPRRANHRPVRYSHTSQPADEASHGDRPPLIDRFASGDGLPPSGSPVDPMFTSTFGVSRS